MLKFLGKLRPKNGTKDSEIMIPEYIIKTTSMNNKKFKM